MKVTASDQPGDGYFFLANWAFEPRHMPSVGRYLMILDRSGDLVYYKKVLAGMDFKRHANGLYSYFDVQSIDMPKVHGEFVIMDEDFREQRRYRSATGYTDMHELLMLKNGNVMMTGVDFRTMDLTAYSGRPNAVVWDHVIEEIDPSGQVAFQWKCFDHFRIGDVTSDCHRYLKLPVFPHGVNLNTLWIDGDDNLLLCSRAIDEVTKIDRRTGEFIWRMGGKFCKNNEFVFTDDPLNGFSHPHGISRLANGNLLLFDNGTLHHAASRAVEYEVDEEKKTAKMVWQYSQDTQTEFMGFVQRLPDGNTLISWGSTTPAFTEVRPDGTKTFELVLPREFYSYRVSYSQWE